MKDIFFSAFTSYKERRRKNGTLLAKECVIWALEAIRANDSMDMKMFLEASSAAPQLQHESFKGCLPITHDHKDMIRDVLKHGLQTDDADRQEELQCSAGVPEHESQSQKKEKFLGWKVTQLRLDSKNAL